MADKKKRSKWQRGFIKGFTGKSVGLNKEKRKKPLTEREAAERRKRIKSQ